MNYLHNKRLLRAAACFRALILFVSVFNLLLICPGADAGIIGGATATPVQSRVSAQVQIFVQGRYICTGTAISNTWVLTARHCFTSTQGVTIGPAQVQVVANTPALDGTTRRAITQLALNPTSDTALVQLNVGFGGISLPYGVDTPLLGTPARVYAWGKTNVNSALPSQTLQGASFRVGVTPLYGSTSSPAIYVYSKHSTLTDGDSGAGVNINALLCGVFVSSPAVNPAGVAVAVPTDSIASWILAITGIAPNPYYTCSNPNKKAKVAIRIKALPLGASITQGIQSSDGAGYRFDLINEIGSGQFMGASGISNAVVARSANAAPARVPNDLTLALDGELTTGSVDFVGRKQDGTEPDPNDEGYPGYRIDQVAGVASCAVPYYQPNLVMLLAGTNDVQQNFDLADAPTRLGNLIDQILAASPKATVLVSDIPPNTDTSQPQLETDTIAYNNAVQAVVAQRAGAGEHVIFSPAMLNPDEVGPDHIHPTDAGYDEIAAAFLSGASEAADNGWLQEPDDDGALPDGCSLSAASGGGPDDGTVGSPGSADKRWEDRGVSFPNGFGVGNSYRWGDVNKDGLSEFFVVKPDQSWSFYWNGGPADGDDWTSWGLGVTRAAKAKGLVGNQLRIADIDGDGEPDCVQVDLNGHVAVQVWDDTKPVGDKICGKPYDIPTNVSGTGQIASTTNISFADIDGDGLMDYVLTDQYGAARVWFNRPKNTIYNKPPSIWWAPTQAAPASATSPRQFRWADLNGDGKADLILITADGGANAWLNVGLNVSGEVVLHNIGTIASAKDVPPADVQFIDVNGDGKADFVRTGWTGVTHIWLNNLSPADFAK